MGSVGGGRFHLLWESFDLMGHISWRLLARLVFRKCPKAEASLGFTTDGIYDITPDTLTNQADGRVMSLQTIHKHATLKIWILPTNIK